MAAGVDGGDGEGGIAIEEGEEGEEEYHVQQGFQYHRAYAVELHLLITIELKNNIQ